jgi:hypothetical protein
MVGVPMQSSRFRIPILILVFLVLIFALPSDPVGALPSAGGTLTPLVNCPSPGCVTGQRLNFKADYSFSSQLDFSNGRNFQICVFTPVNWSVQPIQFAKKGTISNRDYSSPDISHCTDPSPQGYSPVSGASVTILDTSVGDALTFAFRLGISATTTGAILVRLYELHASASWVKMDQFGSSIEVTTKNANVFVANDAITCGANTPC